MAALDLEAALTKTHARAAAMADEPLQAARRWRWLGIAAVASLLVFGLLPAQTWRDSDIPSLQDARPSATPDFQIPKAAQLDDAVDRQVDHFRDYVQNETCHMSSLDLYSSTQPLCPDRGTLLDAMNGGGRIGFDAPYQTRGCDMRWYSTTELCTVLHRFSHVYLVGDSLMRHTLHAINILLRADLVSGARMAWLPADRNPNGTDCHCRNSFTRECSWEYSAVDTDMAWDLDRASVACPNALKPGSVHLSWLAQWPLDQERIDMFTSQIRERERYDGREVYVMGHGAWNAFRVNDTIGWLDQVDAGMRDVMPALFDDAGLARFPRLFISPNAQGEAKPRIFAGEQNNIGLQQYVRQIDPIVRARGYDHLKTYNMSVQAVSEDGTHMSMESNLIKAMMVFNWLDSLKT